MYISERELGLGDEVEAVEKTQRSKELAAFSEAFATEKRYPGVGIGLGLLALAAWMYTGRFK